MICRFIVESQKKMKVQSYNSFFAKYLSSSLFIPCFVFRVVYERLERLKVNLEAFSQRMKAGANIHDSSIDLTHLNNCYEDLHWLILIASR